MANFIKDHPQMRQAWEQYTTGDKAQAQALCRQIIEEAPDSAPNAWLLLALCELAGNDLDAAEAALEHVGDVLALKVPATIVQGQLALAREEFAEAKVLFSVALDYQPESVDALYGLGQALHGLNSPLARNPLRQVVNLQPDHAVAHFLLGVIALEAEDAEEAIAAFAAAGRLMPDSPEIQNNLGLAYQVAGDNKRAEKSYRKAVALKADFAQAWFNVAAMAAANGDQEEAQRCYDKALALDAALGDHGKPWERSDS